MKKMLRSWFMKRGSGKTTIGGAIILFMFFITILSVFWTPCDPEKTDLALRLSPPVAGHIFGCDQLGRDILSRTMVGGQVSLMIALLAVLGTAVLGTVLGVVGGFFGGAVDNIVGIMAELKQALPTFLICILFLAVFGSSILSMVIILSLADWVSIYRTVRGNTLVEREKDYVLATRTLGATDKRLIFRHVVPNVLPSVIVLSTLLIATTILQESSLSYLGVGVARPYPSWGRMISDGQAYIDGAWWVACIPAFAVAITVIGINVLGDGIRQMTKME